MHIHAVQSTPRNSCLFKTLQASLLIADQAWFETLINPSSSNRHIRTTKFCDYIVPGRYMSLVKRKPAVCIIYFKNKDADQLRGNRKADQRLCFRYTDRRIPLLPKYEISSLQPSSVVVWPGLCGTWSETSKTCFLTTRLISFKNMQNCI